MKLTIIGASGHGKVVADIARLNGYDEIEFLDDDETISECAGYPVVGTSAVESLVENDIFVAIGNAAIRQRVTERLVGKTMPVLIHPSAVVAEDVILGSGTVVMAGAVINPGAKLGKGCIVNTCASVDHDCVLGDYVHVAVGAHLCGTITVGCNAWIGAGATVSNNLTVCENVLVGAGATVVKSIEEEGTYIGTPAKVLQSRAGRVGHHTAPRKVLILANYAAGLYGFRKELVKRLVDDGYEIVFTVPEDETEDAVQELCNLGARHVKTEHLSRRGTNPAEDMQLLAFYRGLLRNEKPDVVLTYTIKPNVWGGIACQTERLPYIANVTGLGTSIQDGGPLQRLALGLYGQGLAKAQMVFFQNATNRDFFVGRGVARGKTGLLPGSGVNTEWYGLQEYPAEDGQVTLLTVGRIMRDKGTAELLEAARVIKERHPNVVFQLVGPFDEDWESQVNAACDEGTIEYVPAQPDVRPFYERCSALVHPSYHEGMSNVCLEAAAMGRPILASNVAGCKETFDEGVSGFGFEPQNAGSLIGAIERFLALPWGEKRAMGLAGREKVVREFDRRIVVDRYMDEIERIAGGRRNT